MGFIKIRVGPYLDAAYVSEDPDENGVHHGEWKHVDMPVKVRWDSAIEEWVEVRS